MTSALLHLATMLTAACAAGLWQGLVIATIVAALCGAMRGASAALRHSFLVLSFAGVVTLPFLSLRSLHAGNLSAYRLQLAPWFAILIAVLWLAVALLRATQLWQAWLHLQRVSRRATPVCVQGVHTCNGGSRRAELCSSPDIDAPAIIGFHAPRLLLPEWMLPGLSEEELRQIALHECEHLRRRDDWVNLLVQISLVVFPLNPALPFLMRTIRLQRELAVDEAVVARTAEPLTYATCLTRLAEQRKQRNHLRLALSAWSRKSELVQRVHALLQRSATWTRTQSACAFAGALVVLLGTTTLMAHAPQLVHVADAPAVTVTASTSGDSVVDLASGGLPLVRTAAPTDAATAAGLTARAVATSFHVRADRPGGKRLAHTTVARKPCRLFLVSHHYVQAHRTAAPRMMRMAYVIAPSLPSQADDAPVAFVPALFYTSYTAVPVTNGWLLITL